KMEALMATEVIDVIDSAVKIGLGALISGLSTYWVTRANGKTIELKESKAVKRKLIEEISENADKYFEYTYLYFARLDAIRHNFDSVNSVDNSFWEQSELNIDTQEKGLQDALSAVYIAQSKLELLDLSEALLEMKNYRRGLNDLRVFNSLNEDNFPTVDFLQTWSNTYLPHKDRFRKSLSKTYLGLL
ncbi:TPA: hypothetical protein ACF31P_004596, partial [Vibrio parahaemolyticus]